MWFVDAWHENAARTRRRVGIGARYSHVKYRCARRAPVIKKYVRAGVEDESNTGGIGCFSPGLYPLYREGSVEHRLVIGSNRVLDVRPHRAGRDSLANGLRNIFWCGAVSATSRACGRAGQHRACES